MGKTIDVEFDVRPDYVYGAFAYDGEKYIVAGKDLEEIHQFVVNFMEKRNINQCGICYYRSEK